MSLIAFASLTVLVVMASSQSLPTKVHYDVENARPIFDKFMADFNKKYDNDADKEAHFKAFVENLKQINELNAKSPSAVFGINKFADYTEEEKKSMRGFKPA